jgi:hypothetical protein
VTRRWWGAILVAAALVAAIVVPVGAARRIAGEAVAGVVAGPPSSGDCASWIADPWPRFDDPAPQIDDVFGYPTATVGPCDGPVVGEVVSVTLAPEPPVRISATDYLSQISQCAIDAITYTGSIPPVVDVASGPPIVWAAQPEFRYTRVGPDLAQRAQGQQWSACLIGSADGTPFTGRLRDVLTAGTLPTAFGTCLPSADPAAGDRVGCGRPHPAEVLGSTRLGPSAVTAADLHQACTVFAGRAMRAADPTRAGAIEITVVAPDEWGGTVIAPTADAVADTFVLCVAAARDGRMFTRSLIGVAEGPLPTG